MGSKRRLRRLTVGDTAYEWCFAHRHDRVRGYSGCRSTVSVWRPGSRARLRFVFRPGLGGPLFDAVVAARKGWRAPGVVPPGPMPPTAPEDSSAARRP